MDASTTTRWPVDLQVTYSEVLERLEGLEGLAAEDLHALAREAVLLVVRRRLLGRRPLRAVRT